LRAAVDAGADAVYLGFRDETNARNFPGLNFSRNELSEGIAYAGRKGCKILVAINTYPRAGDPGPWRRAVDDAAGLGAWAVILADIGLLDYTVSRHPALRRHLSVQASAANPETIRFYHDEFGVKRVVLPRVLTVAEIARINDAVPVETEVFAFGGLCVMAEGRCLLASYATGESPNMNGVCSPAEHVRYEDRNGCLVSHLGDFAINVFAEGEPAGYPTLCKGRFQARNRESYLFEEPTSLDAIRMLPALTEAGVTALKIEGRQRGKAYVAQVVTAFRKAVDAVARGEEPSAADLAPLSEGGRQTTGAYEKTWR
jgi:putative protease